MIAGVDPDRVTADVIRDMCLVGPSASIPQQLESFAAIGIDVPVIRFPDPMEPSRQAEILRQIAGAL